MTYLCTRALSTLATPLRGNLVVSPTVTHFGARSFAVAGPKAWNHLPADIRAIDTVSAFKTALKTYSCSVD